MIILLVIGVLIFAENVICSDNQKYRYTGQAAVDHFIKTGECRNCNLNGQDLRAAVKVVKAREESLLNCIICGWYQKSIDLSGASLVNANFIGTNLISAKFIDSKLHGANFTCANLIDANFTRADLTNANLINANFENITYISSYYIYRANFTGANLHGAKLNDLSLGLDTKK